MTSAARAPLRVDTDVHNDHPNLAPYLPKVWRDRFIRMQWGAGWNYSNPRSVHRRDTTPPGGGAPASDPLFLISDHLERYDLDYAILTGPGVVPVAADQDYLSAIASAYNECTADFWLPVSDRFRGSIIVNADDADAAVREIHRHATQKRFVQVLMGAATRKPMGQRDFHPIYAAAVEHGLPLALHPGTEGAGQAGAPTPVGWPSRYMEWHNILPIGYMAQVNSLVTEGAFEIFPSLRVVLVEGGVAWLPHLMWRMDKNYKALRDTTPWLHRLPSEYILDHVLLTTQPIEEPENIEHLRQIFDMIEAGRTLMYSSDYPHWDFDNPEVVLSNIDEDTRTRIMGTTAAELYGLTEHPPRPELPPYTEYAQQPEFVTIAGPQE